MYYDLVTEIINLFLNDEYNNFSKSALSKDDSNLISHPDAHRVLKNII